MPPLESPHQPPSKRVDDKRAARKWLVWTRIGGLVSLCAAVAIGFIAFFSPVDHNGRVTVSTPAVAALGCLLLAMLLFVRRP